jgi:hypothetical protein
MTDSAGGRGTVGPITNLHCTIALRARWPQPLAARWSDEYPGLFDDDDRRLAGTQPTNHFFEWFAVVHLFQRDGSLSLQEKYAYPSHQDKQHIVGSLFSEDQWAAIVEVERTGHAQLPDLLVVGRDRSIRFAEVKGHRDRLRPLQNASHDRLAELGYDVEIINIALAEVPSPA